LRIRLKPQLAHVEFLISFYCPTEKLAIELDGAHHFTEDGLKYDEERTAYLNSVGIRVVRFENRLVFGDPEYVLSEIRKYLLPPRPSGTPP
jgi:very-short-patch-repair endonuclease